MLCYTQNPQCRLLLQLKHLGYSNTWGVSSGALPGLEFLTTVKGSRTLDTPKKRNIVAYMTTHDRVRLLTRGHRLAPAPDSGFHAELNALQLIPKCTHNESTEEPSLCWSADSYCSTATKQSKMSVTTEKHTWYIQRMLWVWCSQRYASSDVMRHNHMFSSSDLSTSACYTVW